MTACLAAAVVEPRAVVRPPGARMLLAAMTAAELLWRQHGRIPPAGWGELYDVLAQVVGSATGTGELPPHGPREGSTPSPSSVVMVDPVSTSEAAQVLECTARNVRGLARRGAFATAHRGPTGWVLERGEVLARAAGHAGGRLAGREGGKHGTERPPGRRRPSVDEVRAAYYRHAPQQAWIREIQLNPLTLIVANDADGQVTRVPVHVADDGTISFGEPTRVRVEYVPTDTGRLDASRLVFASRSDNTGTRVHAVASRARVGAALMPPPHRPQQIGDRPRRAGEDPVSWAVRTGRILPTREAFWRGQVAASAGAADALARLAPAVPGTEPRLVTAAAADGEDPAEEARLDAYEQALHSPYARWLEVDRDRQVRPRERAVSAAGPTDPEDSRWEEIEEALHSPQNTRRGREHARREHLRAVVEGRAVVHNYSRDQVAAMAAELAAYEE